MPMPSNVPAWNTSGTNRVEPTSGEKIAGWVANSAVNSSYFNWLLFTIYEWVLFLQGIEGEALTWTAPQGFEGGADFSNSVADTVTLTAHSNGTGTAIYSDGPMRIDTIGSAGLTILALSGGEGINVNADGGSLFQGTSGDPSEYILNVNQIGSGYALTVSSASNDVPAFVVGTSGTDMHSAQFAGNGAGAGLIAYGGAFGDGGYFQGLDGDGGYFRAGAGSAGGLGQGASGAGGLIGIGGAGAWGVSAEANGVAALRAVRYDSASLPIMDARGTISFENASQPAGNFPVKNQLTKNGYAKVLAMFVGNNTVTPTIESRQNVTSVAQVIAGGTNGQITVVFAQPFTTNVYSCDIRCENTGAYLAEVLTKNTGSVVFRFVDSPTNTPQTASALSACRIVMEIYGAQ